MNRQSTKLFSIVLAFVALITFGATQVNAQVGKAIIVIPSIQVNAPIVDAPLAGPTWDVSHLNMTVGRFEGMPWFGSNTNVVLGGHSIGVEGQPDVFYHLEYVQVGDEIYVEVDGVQYFYVVTETLSISENDVDILHPTANSQLTLMACDTASFDGENYVRRTVIIATEISVGA